MACRDSRCPDLPEPQAYTSVLCGSRAVLERCVGHNRTVAHSAAQRALCGSAVLVTALPGMNESTLGQALRGWALVTHSLGAASDYFNLTVVRVHEMNETNTVVAPPPPPEISVLLIGGVSAHVVTAAALACCCASPHPNPIPNPNPNPNPSPNPNQVDLMQRGYEQAGWD